MSTQSVNDCTFCNQPKMSRKRAKYIHTHTHCTQIALNKLSIRLAIEQTITQSEHRQKPSKRGWMVVYFGPVENIECTVCVCMYAKNLPRKILKSIIWRSRFICIATNFGPPPRYTFVHINIFIWNVKLTEDEPISVHLNSGLYPFPIVPLSLRWSCLTRHR